jgi:hypothetical protein
VPVLAGLAAGIGERYLAVRFARVPAEESDGAEAERARLVVVGQAPAVQNPHGAGPQTDRRAALPLGGRLLVYLHLKSFRAQGDGRGQATDTRSHDDDGQ